MTPTNVVGISMLQKAFYKQKGMLKRILTFNLKLIEKKLDLPAV